MERGQVQLQASDDIATVNLLAEARITIHAIGLALETLARQHAAVDLTEVARMVESAACLLDTALRRAE
jgi:hypothetical protein